MWVGGGGGGEWALFLPFSRVFSNLEMAKRVKFFWWRPLYQSPDSRVALEVNVCAGEVCGWGVVGGGAQKVLRLGMTLRCKGSNFENCLFCCLWVVCVCVG